MLALTERARRTILYAGAISSPTNLSQGTPVDEPENTTPSEDDAPEVVVDYRAECDSLTARSVLTFEAGHDPKTNEPMLRIVRNSGGGMFCKDWAPIELIDAILAKADPLTGRAFNEVHPGRSINQGSFTLAILKDLGVVQAKDDNTRHHERVAGKTVLEALAARIAAANSSKGTRKSKAE
jgi:hypothetical protein